MLFKSLFFMVIVLSFVVQPVNCGSFLSFQPWRVVKYSSIDFESHMFNYEQFVELSNSNPDRTLDKVYLYITTHATDEALYEGVDPYCMTFCFWTYDGVKEIQIDSIEILNPDLNGQSDDYFEGKTSLITEYHQTVNSMTMEVSVSEYTIGTYSTPYVFNLKNYKRESIDVRIMYTIGSKKNEIVVPLKRYEEKGLFQYRY